MRVGLGMLSLVVFAPLVAVMVVAPIKRGARIEFLTSSTGATIGLLLADILVASTVVRAFKGHRFVWSDRLQLILMVGFPPLMLGVSLILSLISIANCVPSGADLICSSVAVTPNVTIAVLSSGVCLLVAQYLIAFVARPQAVAQDSGEDPSGHALGATEHVTDHKSPTN